MIAVAVALAWSGATTSDSGTVHTGVGSEAEARSLPCAPGESGPVVCVPDRGGDWRLSSDASGECTESMAGWTGQCVFAFDAGDHLRVWGTRGIPPTRFTVTWLASTSPPVDDGSRQGAAVADGGSEETKSRETQPGEVEPPAVAARPVTVTTEPSGEDAPNLARSRTRGEVPDRALWDPPVTEVPGWSELAAAPSAPYPTTPDGLHRQDAGAPAAAGGIALLAVGWVAWTRRRDGASGLVA